MILDLAPQEVEFLLNSLAHRPYNEVWPLIDKIKQQAQSQVGQVQQPPTHPQQAIQ